ncbi:MAG TPA: hypothetical protein VFM61_05425 [Pseudidiomarina sp.]|nr:hypothetical protein [Pseudidiomarina sp.]
MLMCRNARLAFAVLVACLISPALSAQTLQDAIARAQQATAAGDIDSAFANLQALEYDYAGDPRFDYWYGVIALRAGEESEAIIALQRVIAVNPNHAGAHMELVGANLRQDNLERAQHHLTIAKSLNPPERAAEMIQRYEEVIAERQQRARDGVAVVVLGTDVGYDSNYVNYPDSFDLFQGTFLEGIAILEADETAFATIRGSYFRQKPINEQDYVELTASGQARVNQADEASAFNTNIVQLSALYGERINERQQFKYGVEASKIWLDELSFRSHIGLQFTYEHRMTDQDTVRATTRLRDFHFKNNRNDYRSLLGEAEWTHEFSETLTGRFRGASELERVSNTPARPGGDATRLYLSSDFDYQWDDRNKLTVGLIYGRLRYHDPGFAIFNRGQEDIRSDDLLSLRSEWQHTLTSNWRLAMSAQYRDQRSSVDFFDLDQSLVQWTVTYAY